MRLEIIIQHGVLQAKKNKITGLEIFKWVGKKQIRKTKTMTKSKQGKGTELTKTKNVFSKPTTCWLVLLNSHKVESSEKYGKAFRPECRQVLGAFFFCYVKAIVSSTIPLAGSSRLYKKTD